MDRSTTPKILYEPQRRPYAVHIIFWGDRPVHKLPFGPKSHELFVILYTTDQTYWTIRTQLDALDRSINCNITLSASEAFLSHGTLYCNLCRCNLLLSSSCQKHIHNRSTEGYIAVYGPVYHPQNIIWTAAKTICDPYNILGWQTGP
jgi:hypothetical protein